MNLLLDTAVFLWLIAGDERLSEPARSLVRDPDHRVWLSAVSLWEISVKQKAGRLTLPGPAWSYVTAARRRGFVAGDKDLQLAGRRAVQMAHHWIKPFRARCAACLSTDRHRARYCPCRSNRQ